MTPMAPNDSHHVSLLPDHLPQENELRAAADGGGGVQRGEKEGVGGREGRGEGEARGWNIHGANLNFRQHSLKMSDD